VDYTVSGGLAKRTGSALGWRAVQHAGVKLIFLVRLLVLAWLLGPDEFGVLAIAVVAVEFLMHFTNFGMVPALVQRAEAERGHYDTAWTVGMLRAAGVGAVVALAAPLIADIFAEPRATNVIRVLALRPVLQAAASIGAARLTREFRFGALALLYISEALANSAVSIALARAWGVWALVAGSLAGPIVLAAISYIVAWHRPRLRLEGAALASLIRFGRWIFLTGVIAVIGRSVLQAAVSRTLGVVELGLYTLAARLAFLPAEAASEVVGAVAFPLFSRLQSDLEKTAAAFRALLTGTCVMLLPVVGLIVVLSPSLVEEVLSERWQGTAPIVALLAVASGIGLLGDTAVPMLQGVGRPHTVTVLETVQSTMLAVMIWILAARFGLAGAAYAWMVALAASQIVGILFVYRVSPRCFERLATPILTIVAASAAGSVTAYWIDSIVGGIVGLVLASAAGLGLVGLLLLVADRWLDLGLMRSLGRVFPRVAAMLGHAPAQT
jgi:PST family polysaccharide transporter/lipopolysaccharide exporter